MNAHIGGSKFESSIRWAILAALSFLLFVVPLQAQRGGGGGVRSGMGRGGGVRAGGGARAASGARVGGFRDGGEHSHRGRNRYGYGDVFVDPYLYGGWYDEPLDYGPDYYGPPEQPVPMRPAMMMPPPMPERIPSDPKVMEVPGAAKEAATKPVPPAVFVLNSGERIETQQYLLTWERLQITADHRLRNIPWTSVDVNATLAADRQRGIDLHIPNGGSEISLGF